MQAGIVPRALWLGLNQLSDPRIVRVLLSSLTIMALITAPFALIFIGLAWVIELVTPARLSLPWFGQVNFLGVLTDGLTSRASWVFWTYAMSPLAVAIMGLYLDRIVDAVEKRHFPDLPAVKTRSAIEMSVLAIRFFGLMMAVNLAALVVSFAAGQLAPVVFVAANGLLLAREYFDTVALRRLSPPRVAGLRARHRGVLWIAGSTLALGLTVPFLNLLVPLLGTAALTHMFHGLMNRAAS